MQPTWSNIERARWCPFCKEQFELTDKQIQYGEDPLHGCGTESVAWSQSGQKSDNEIYAEENPR